MPGWLKSEGLILAFMLKENVIVIRYWIKLKENVLEVDVCVHINTVCGWAK